MNKEQIDSGYLKIHLTDAPAVRIEVAKWPVIASAELYNDDAEFFECEYHCLRVRRHEDCRAIVYGERWLQETEKAQGFRADRGGKLLGTPHNLDKQTDEIAQVIRELGEHLRLPEHFVQSCIDQLPAVDLF